MPNPSELTRQEPEENLIKCPRCQDLIRELVQSPLDSGILICDKCHAKTMLNLAGSPKDRISTMPEPKTYSTREALDMMLRGYYMKWPHAPYMVFHWDREVYTFVASDFRPRSLLHENHQHVKWIIHSYPQQFDAIEAVRLAKETGRRIKHVGNRQFYIRWDQAKLEFITDDGQCYPWDYTDTEAMWDFYEEPKPTEPAQVEQVCGTCRYHKNGHCRIIPAENVPNRRYVPNLTLMRETADSDTCEEWRERPASTKQGDHNV